MWIKRQHPHPCPVRPGTNPTSGVLPLKRHHPRLWITLETRPGLKRPFWASTHLWGRKKPPPRCGGIGFRYSLEQESAFSTGWVGYPQFSGSYPQILREQAAFCGFDTILQCLDGARMREIYRQGYPNPLSMDARSKVSSTVSRKESSASSRSPAPAESSPIFARNPCQAVSPSGGVRPP